MINTGTAEIYFIAAMMILIMVISIAAVYFFIRTYKKEKADKQTRAEQKRIKDQKSKIEN